MSGLLERIVRRRRASAGRRLGPPPSPDDADRNGRASVNGSAPPDTVVRVLRPVPAPDPQAAPQLQPEPEPTSEPEREPTSGPEPGQEQGQESAPGLRERARIRRRTRYLRRLREVQLRDLGGFMVELNRFEQERPELVQEKLDTAARTDTELRTLERALGEQHALRELREPGIGACPECGAVHSTEDRFCASCGASLRDDDSPSDHDPLSHGHVYPE